MKSTTSLRRILERMARIERMERGKVCKMAGREHYNHQTWRNGRNVVRYVKADQAASLREAIAGYRRFAQLAEAYADEVIRRTRAQAASAARNAPTRNKGARRKPMCPIH